MIKSVKSFLEAYLSARTFFNAAVKARDRCSVEIRHVSSFMRTTEPSAWQSGFKSSCDQCESLLSHKYEFFGVECRLGYGLIDGLFTSSYP